MKEKQQVEAEIKTWMERCHRGASIYQVIDAMKDEIAELRAREAQREPFPGVDIDRAHDKRRRDAGSGQALQFYEGAADRRSDAMPDWISYNAPADVLTIHGINYSGQLFREFGSAFPVGQAFKLANRADGVLTIMRMPDVGGAEQ